MDIYHSSPNEVLEKFNNVLSGKESVNDLLTEYNISLENEATVSSFKKMCDSYEKNVMEKHNESELLYIKD